ncbi:MAG: uroporphyrinogen-III C-methyltransferase [Leptonema sp. (in: bacteria)]
MVSEGKKGKVYLVGAGPGDPELITLKGYKILKQSDIIFYDSLISEELFKLPDVSSKEKIFVGKRKGKHSYSQEEINELLYQQAKNGKTVVRLKGGDPFIFGRGGEEIIYLNSRGIEVEVIPGITTALAVSATLKFPLTHRELGRSVIFLSGYSSYNSEDESGFPDYNWELLADPSITLVFYMGLYHLERITERLLKAGRSEETPVVIVSKVSLPDQKIIKGKLNNIYRISQIEKIEYPALLVVGNVLYASLNF